VAISVYRRCTPCKIILNLKSEIATPIPPAQADSIMLAMTETGGTDCFVTLATQAGTSVLLVNVLELFS
jgi:hypothetical protein